MVWNLYGWNSLLLNLLVLVVWSKQEVIFCFLFEKSIIAWKFDVWIFQSVCGIFFTHFSSFKLTQFEPVWSILLLTIVFLINCVVYCLKCSLESVISIREQARLFTSKFGITNKKFEAAKSVNIVVGSPNNLFINQFFSKFRH